MFWSSVLLIRAIIIGKRVSVKEFLMTMIYNLNLYVFFGSNSKETMTDIQSVLTLSGRLCSPDTFASIHEDGTAGCL